MISVTIAVEVEVAAAGSILYSVDVTSRVVVKAVPENGSGVAEIEVCHEGQEYAMPGPRFVVTNGTRVNAGRSISEWE